jgi:2-polyprenyl-3-methyl-5-hydroxy-6-metoxy-1,4-benzoquinol methylase
LARFPEESYRQCPHCGIIYLARLGEAPIEYEKNYFFGDYKKQYGKTYLEDFPNLVEAGKRRLEHIKDILRFTNGKPSILDIGCAYGPFLAAAAECGFSPAGVEPASDAARYVKEELGFPCYQGFFPAANPDEIRRLSNDGESGFDAVTLWYVIEHFEEVGKVLHEIHGLLKEGGVLAFSTPSFSGISGRKSLAVFLKNSPPDHYTVWSPKICAWILRRYGFCLRKIVVTGHHPERFPLIGRFANPAKKGALYGFLLFISRLFGLGDTFEVYAVKG